MIIRTYEHEYPVSSVSETNAAYDMYICRNEADGGFCRIMCVKDRSLFPDIVSRLTSELHSDAFTDHIEYFNYDNMLCIVMRYTQGVTLADKLEMEKPTFSERLEIGRRILERAVLQDIPEYFLDKCLSPDCIIIAPDLSVEFNYPIGDIIENKRCDASDRTDKLLRLLFARELERKVPDELTAFFRKLPELLEYSMIELYSEYYMMMGRINAADAELEQPKSIWFRIWAWIRSLGRVAKRIAILALMVLSVVYLIYTIVNSGSSRINKPNFDSIGTVTIDKSR